MGILAWDGATIAMSSWARRRARRRRAAERSVPTKKLEPVERSIADEAQDWLFWREHLGKD
jgi:hypothetical protein